MIIDIISCVAELLLSGYFFSSFGKKRFPGVRFYGCFLLILALYILLVSFSPDNSVLLPGSILLTVAYSFLYDYKRIFALVYGLIFSAVSAVGELLTLALISFLTSAPLQTATDTPLKNLTGLIFAKGTAFLTVVIIRRFSKKSFDGISRTSFVLLLTLPVSTILIAVAVSEYAAAMSPKTQILYIFSLAVLICANTAVFRVCEKEIEAVSANERAAAAEALLNNQYEYYESIFSYQNELRKTRHDIKNIGLALLHETRAGNTPEVEKILTEKIKTADETVFPEVSAEYAFESLIYIKFRQYPALKTQYNKHISAVPCTDPVDFAVLTANILDNALENTPDGGSVSISVSSDENNITVLCRNDSRPVDVNKLQTTKSDRRRHGFGIGSIRKITEKYNGNAVFSYSDGIFSVSVIIPQKT